MQHGTVVSYNGVTLKDILSTSHSYEIEWDQNRVDPIGIRVHIRFHSVLHTSGTTTNRIGMRVNWTLPTNQGLAPGLRDAIERWLMPRKRFQMWIDGEAMWDIAPGDVEVCNTQAQAATMYAYQEISHGPRTKIDVKSIAGGHSARCDFDVEFVVPIKCGSGDASSLKDWLNMRWWVADDIDGRTMMTRRTYQGQIRVRNRNVHMHALARYIAFPPLASGFQREAINYHEAPDGLTIQFTIVDQQKYAVAPFPATHWEGTYAVEFGPAGYVCTLHLNVKLSGPPDVPKPVLLQLAERILEYKLNYSKMKVTDAETDGSFVVTHARFEEELSENVIRMSISCKVAKSNQTLLNIPNLGAEVLNLGTYLPQEVSGIENLDESLPQYEGQGWHLYSPSRGFVPKWPSTLLQMFICQLQNPCCPQSLPYVPSEQPTTPEPEEDEPGSPSDDQPLTGTMAPLRREEQHHSEEHVNHMYLEYTISNEYETDTGDRGFPQSGGLLGDINSIALGRLHEPTTVRKVHISAQRVNKSPVVPTPHSWTDHNGIEYTLKKSRFEPGIPQLSADGRDKILSMEATYYYYMSRMPRLEEGEDYPTGVGPVSLREDMMPGEWSLYDLTVTDESSFKDPATIFDNQDAET